MRANYLLPFALLIACGDNHDNTPADAAVDVRGDAPIDAPPPIPCAYTETSDATNDDLFGTGTAEMTMLSFTSTVAICGKLESSHYENGPQRIDVDSYKFTVPAATKGLVYLQAPGAENYDSVLIEIYALAANIDETGKFISTYAVTSADLPPGDYIVTVTSYDATAPTAALDYKLVLATDTASRCAKSTAAATYTENLDGLTADGNDVIEVRYGMATPRRKLTDNALDVVEPTGIMVAPNMSYHVTGTNIVPAVAPASWADSFQDRDTYQITMGANANQLSVRLNWPGTTADFDFFVFPMGGVIEQANGWYNAKMEPEFTTLAVIPGMSYWIWAGADDSSTGQPINYDITVCGGTFTPF